MVTTQLVRSTDKDGTIIDWVDNVVAFVPPATVKDLIPDAGFDLRLMNPLVILESKFMLVHDAKVESSGTLFRTNIALKSAIDEYHWKCYY